MTWSEAEVEAILERMRGGATVMTGGSRCHTTYGHRDGAWFQEDFDEGYTQEGPSSEAVIRGLITREPQLFASILAAPHRQRLAAAMVAGDVPAARAALRAALAYGDGLGEGVILEAVLTWPQATPSEGVAALIREKLLDFTAYHVFMGAVGWDRSPAIAAQGVTFVDRLVAMVGEAPGCFRVRASFHELAGDLEAAVRDTQAELDRTPTSDWRHQGYQEQLERLRRRLAAGS